MLFYYICGAMIRYVELLLSDEDETTGVQAVALVDEPAVQRNFVMLRSSGLHFVTSESFPSYYSFDKDSRTLYGVLMLANVPILRLDREGNPYYVFFRPSTIRRMMVRASKNGTFNVVNLMHHATKVVEGVYYIGGYQVDFRRRILPHFQADKITDGSWVGIYHVENEEILEMIREGKFRGFSLEGDFIHKEVPLL